MGLAGYLAWLSPRVDVPLEPAAQVLPGQIEARPLRAVQHDPPQVVIGGYQHHCNDCHRLFKSAPERRSPLAQHTHILLDHGMNDRCFNCHDRNNREKLVLRNGKPAPFEDVAVLCAQCHGTTYRDWQRGMHGKDLGSWSPAVGPQHRLVCTECHDPHVPAYADFIPLPGPRTLRMGRPPAPDEEGTDGKRNPLAQRHPPGAEHRPSPETPGHPVQKSGLPAAEGRP